MYDSQTFYYKKKDCTMNGAVLFTYYMGFEKIFYLSLFSDITQFYIFCSTSSAVIIKRSIMLSCGIDVLVP